MYYPALSPELDACLPSAVYKFCNLTSFIRQRRKIKNNIYLKFIMLTDSKQIFRNCFVIIYCHLTKVSSQINKCWTFEPSITIYSMVWDIHLTLTTTAIHVIALGHVANFLLFFFVKRYSSKWSENVFKKINYCDNTHQIKFLRR